MLARISSRELTEWSAYYTLVREDEEAEAAAED